MVLSFPFFVTPYCPQIPKNKLEFFTFTFPGWRIKNQTYSIANRVQITLSQQYGMVNQKGGKFSSNKFDFDIILVSFDFILLKPSGHI